MATVGVKARSSDGGQMNVIKRDKLIKFWRKHNQSEGPLEDWYRKALKAQWRNIEDVRRLYPSADIAIVGSGKTVVIFNIGGNNYRLIAAIHYNREKIYILDIMTHDEYSKNKWKERY